MADNVTINDANDTDVAVAADEIGSAWYQRIKLVHGADGTNDGDVSSANPLPVTSTPSASGTATGGAAAVTEAASATILAANADRLGAIVFNPLGVDLLINLGTAAASTAAVARLGPRQAWVLPVLYTGILTGRLATSGSDGNVYVQELTA